MPKGITLFYMDY